MQLLAADGFADDVARLSPVGVGATARPGLLRIAALILNEPRGGFQELEMGVDGGLRGNRQPGEQKKESGRMFHRVTPGSPHYHFARRGSKRPLRSRKARRGPGER